MNEARESGFDFLTWKERVPGSMERKGYGSSHCLYTTYQLERLAKEAERQAKVEVFCGEDAVEKFLYSVLSQLDEA